MKCGRVSAVDDDLLASSVPPTHTSHTAFTQPRFSTTLNLTSLFPTTCFPSPRACSSLDTLHVVLFALLPPSLPSPLFPVHIASRRVISCAVSSLRSVQLPFLPPFLFLFLSGFWILAWFDLALSFLFSFGFHLRLSPSLSWS